MRRSNLPITIITLAAFAAIVLYIGTYLYRSLTNSLNTAALEYVTIGDSYQSAGVIVREEQLLDGGGGYVLTTAQEGEKVAKDQQLAVRYTGSDTLAVAAQVKELQLRLDQIDAMIGGGSADDYALESVLSLSAALHTGSSAGLSAALSAVDTYVFSGGSEYDQLQNERSSLQSQIDTLQGSVSTAGAQSITAGQPGIFSTWTDGLESLKPDALDNLTPAGFDTLKSGQQTLPETVLGKLITGNDWYYATTIPAEDAVKLTPGGTVRIGFSRTYGETLNMTVVSVSAEEDGRCAAVFSSNRYLSSLTQVRDLYGEIMFETVAGYSIPLEALHMDEKGTYIYIVTNLQAEKVYVDVQSATDTGYIITETDGSKLYRGVDVITSGNDLYDGKVVQ